MNTESGIIFRVGETHSFLPAEIARQILALPRITPIPGAPRWCVGLAVVHGNPTAIVSAEPEMPLHVLVLSMYAGETLGLGITEVIAAGAFPRDQDGNVVGPSGPVRDFDFASLYARVRQSEWRAFEEAPSTRILVP